ncbi:MAG: hypothetical protein ACLRVQ_02235 [Lachnospiraceae bacterium]
MVVRKTLCLFLCLILSASMMVMAYGENLDEAEGKEKLSELTEEEVIQRIQELGVDIPQNFLAKDSLGEFILNLIRNMENNPQWINRFNIEETYIFANDIKDMVDRYYGLDISSTQLNTNFGVSLLGDGITSLKYSRLLSNYNRWYPEWTWQNCYGFAVNLEASLRPGYTMNYNYDTSASIITYAGAVAYDLRNNGYTDASYSTERPSSIPAGKHLICIRKGDYDFHLMAYRNGRWEHKPGRTIPLKYLYQNANYAIWTNESMGDARSGSLNVFNPPDATYDSQIYYIVY